MSRANRGAAKFLALALALFLSLSLLASSEGEARRKKRRPWREVAPGVSFRVYRLPKPVKVRVVRYSPKARATIDTVLAKNKLGGFARVTRMAKTSNALVAINGDFSQPNGRPVFTFARDALLDQTPKPNADGGLAYGRNFAMDVNKKKTFFGHPKTRAWVWDAKLGDEGSYQVHRVNEGGRGEPASRQLRAFTPAGRATVKPPQNGCYVRLRAHRRPFTVSPTRAPMNNAGVSIAPAGVQQSHFVEKRACRAKPIAPKGGIVLYAPQSGDYADALRAMAWGERIVFGWSLGWPDVFDSVGGNPTLIERGAVQRQSIDDGSAFASDRHPRTAVAYNARTRKVFFVTVDGRRPGYSVGMTLEELTRFLRRRLGATDALNLDGGGSTTMVVRGKVRGRPSDGSVRRVSSALVILRRRDPGERFGNYPARPQPAASSAQTRPAPSPSPAPPDAPAAGPPTGAPKVPSRVPAYRRMVGDPASVGGLSVYLERRGHELPSFLERAADEFRSSRSR